MSLINSASPWTSDINPSKRISTLQKTMKLKPYIGGDEAGDVGKSQPANFTSDNTSIKIPTTEDALKYNQTRKNRVYDLIDRMTSAASASDEDGSGPAKFTPPPLGENTSIRRQGGEETGAKVADEPIPLHTNELMPNPPALRPLLPVNRAYTSIQTPYYASMGIKNDANDANSTNGKIMDRLNHIVRLIENMEHEKTEHIMEEVVLYGLLGVFTIYVLDAFARSGKYTR